MDTSLSGPQVFINFRGEDVRNHFVSFLAPALRTAKINVFTDEDQDLGSHLAELFTMIEESEIALVIFSKNYADSEWCLDELAKIKERMDQGRLKVIPIFYMVSPSVVKELRQDFGDKFRDTKRKYLHQPQRIQRWEEALVSIPDIKGMPRAEQSDTTDFEFINSMVVGIQKLLVRMAVRGNPAREENRQGGYMAPSLTPARKLEREENFQTVPARELEREVTSQGGSTVPFMLPARKLEITHSENSQKWAWSFINEASNYAAHEIATMIKIHWLKIVGTFETGSLTPGTKYEAVFLVKLEDYAIGWEQPVTLKLKVEQHDGSDNRVDRNENLKDYIGHNWVDILAGVFVVPPRNTPAKITCTMYQYVTEVKKRGLLVEGLAIRPTN